MYAPSLWGQLFTGIDLLFQPQYQGILSGKNIAMLTNCSALDVQGVPSYQRLKCEKNLSELKPWKLKRFFAPEHGFWGEKRAAEEVNDEVDEDGIEILSLHGDTRRPTEKMLEGLDLIVVDLQDIGARSYTYISTLFYLMEESAKKNIEVVVLDRPNPCGRIIDGPGLDESVRSFMGYINVPFCHGMTIGELARFFNDHYEKNCKLTVVPFRSTDIEKDIDSDLWWAPTSPQIPSIRSARGYSITGMLSCLSWVNVGVGYTLPFELIGAPWIQGNQLCDALNQLNLPGVKFQKWAFRPYFGLFALQPCEGVRVIITSLKLIEPFTTQVHILDTLYKLYPHEYQRMLDKMTDRKWEIVAKFTGVHDIRTILEHPQFMRSELLKKIREAKIHWTTISKKYQSAEQ